MGTGGGTGQAPARASRPRSDRRVRAGAGRGRRSPRVPVGTRGGRAQTAGGVRAHAPRHAAVPWTAAPSASGRRMQRGDVRLSLPLPSPFPSIFSARPQDPIAWQKGDTSLSPPLAIETSLGTPLTAPAAGTRGVGSLAPRASRVLRSPHQGQHICDPEAGAPRAADQRTSWAARTAPPSPPAPGRGRPGAPGSGTPRRAGGDRPGVSRPQLSVTPADLGSPPGPQQPRRPEPGWQSCHFPRPPARGFVKVNTPSIENNFSF